MIESKPSIRLVVYFDGKCPLCRREIAHYQRLDKGHKRIRWVDITQDHTELEKRGISFEEAMQRFHSIDKTGKILTGVDTFIALWKELPYYWPLAFFARLPGVYFLLNCAYKRFAKWRFRRSCNLNCTSISLRS